MPIRATLLHPGEDADRGFARLGETAIQPPGGDGCLPVSVPSSNHLLSWPRCEPIKLVLGRPQQPCFTPFAKPFPSFHPVFPGRLLAPKGAFIITEQVASGAVHVQDQQPPPHFHRRHLVRGGDDIPIFPGPRANEMEASRNNTRFDIVSFPRVSSVTPRSPGDRRREDASPVISKCASSARGKRPPGRRRDVEANVWRAPGASAFRRGCLGLLGPHARAIVWRQCGLIMPAFGPESQRGWSKGNDTEAVCPSTVSKEHGAPSGVRWIHLPPAMPGASHNKKGSGPFLDFPRPGGATGIW